MFYFDIFGKISLFWRFHTSYFTQRAQRTLRTLRVLKVWRAVRKKAGAGAKPTPRGIVEFGYEEGGLALGQFGR